MVSSVGRAGTRTAPAMQSAAELPVPAAVPTKRHRLDHLFSQTRPSAPHWSRPALVRPCTRDIDPPAQQPLLIETIPISDKPFVSYSLCFDVVVQGNFLSFFGLSGSRYLYHYSPAYPVYRPGGRRLTFFTAPADPA
jgi:hypothetical protein